MFTLQQLEQEIEQEVAESVTNILRTLHAEGVSVDLREILVVKRYVVEAMLEREEQHLAQLLAWQKRQRELEREGEIWRLVHGRTRP